MIGAKSCVQRIVVKAEGARWPSGFAPLAQGARWMARCSRRLKRRRLPSSTPGGRGRLRNVLFVLFIGLAPACAPAPDSTPTARTVGLLLNEPEAFVGYTLFNRVRSKTIYLIDNQGRVVHTWELEANALFAKLLENGNLLTYPYCCIRFSIYPLGIERHGES